MKFCRKGDIGRMDLSDNNIEKEKAIYLECNSGISGDMLVAALIDLGADWDILTEALSSISDLDFKVEKSKVKKAGISCMDFNVILNEDNHDHDMEYLHGHEHSHQHDHEHSHHHDHNHSHVHRGIEEINEIIERCKISDNARKIAKEIFLILAKAEAKAHDVEVSKVHFHEVGAIDSIVDIIAIAVCIDNLGIENIIVPKLCEGMGTVMCQHGILPIPVPAVARIVEANDLELEIFNCNGEFVTPTGAASVAALMTSKNLPEKFAIKSIGVGAGKREYERPSMLRAMIIEYTQSQEAKPEDYIYKLETNIDDSTGEELGFLMEILMEAGARDVHYFPVFMKKNRPGWQLNVICDEEKLKKMEKIIFLNSTTIGIRKQKMERSVLDRKIDVIESKWGKVRVKLCDIDGEKRIYPEYEDVVKICKEYGLNYKEVYRIIVDTYLVTNI